MHNFQLTILGNQCDQRFSILADKFKAETILTIEDLKEKILTAPISSQPIVKSLWYVFGWKNFITDKLSDVELRNHSKFHSFLLTVENDDVKLRAKVLPQDTCLVPRAGIKLLKDGLQVIPISPADVRVDELNFDKIIRGISVFLADKPMDVRMKVLTSWDKLRSQLENLPNKLAGCERMILSDLPKILDNVEVMTYPEQLQREGNAPQLIGEFYPEDVTDGDLENEIHEGIDVCIYTENMRSRPWVGRILRVCEDNEFILQWYSRKSSRSTVFTALQNPDGSPSIATLSYNTVMFWRMSEPQSRTANSFSLTQHWLQVIMSEYAEIDDRGRQRYPV